MNPEQKDQNQTNTQKAVTTEADRVEIVYYTDPLCCWSWAIEPQWRKLQYLFANSIHVRYCMSGLLPAWGRFNDALQSVSKPIQMGPVWMEAGHISGMPVHSQIWMENPPASSYLACMAVKCAGLQSTVAAEKYLRRLREAVMIDGKNIAVLSALMEVATGLAEEQARLLNLALFKDDLQNGRGMEAFRSDLQEVQQHGINRFPTLVFRRKNHPSLIITGYRPYPILLEMLQRIHPDIQPAYDHIDPSAYARFWGVTTPRELEEAGPEKI